ncbi:DUF4037 domain-containing protein [Paenibacillus ihuae]|uniref:DUF4037 domain-containing protein n=1 Tax=Paenibacillus ihuae TaxID=1232431 RepID=UPI0006D55861|nr:DUF4037 domain-containing protein [Paenibacillus ihuae]
MSRPHVTVTSPNLLDSMQKELHNRLQDFTALDGVCGITLNGGCSRGYADELSEIDLVLYLEDGQHGQWSNGRSPLPLGITKLGEYLYDIKISNLNEEQKKPWDSVALWDLSYARILYDPSGQIARFMSEKLAQRPERMQVEGLMFNCWWHFRLAGDIWLHRGDILQGHAMMNTAATQLIEAVFIANREYVPHAKWLIHLSRTLPWTPAGWEAGLMQIMSTGDCSRESLITRQAAIQRIWSEVDAYIISQECPGYPLNIMHKTFYDLLELLLAHDNLTLETWTGRMTLSMLSAEPFIRFTTVTEDLIIVDKHKFMSIRPADLYAWHSAIVEQLHAELHQQH